MIHFVNTLTPQQVEQFSEQGFLAGIDVFSESEVTDLNTGLDALCQLLHPGESTKEIREWHEASRWLYDICMDNRLLDVVEDVLGDFYMWASNYFIKEPNSPESVAWHQDSYYWPLDPIKSLTVWIACADSNEGNGAMRVIPGSHRTGILKHSRMESDDTDSVLLLECETGQFREDAAEPLIIKAGQISIHDDKIVHGSPGNPSDRRRVALTVRYSPSDVKCDLSVNPHFRIYHGRGERADNGNPLGDVPTEKFGRLERDHLSVEEAGE
jgi:ectoine hydroxylase-related dioxygenase (phytanoyl-CoA dioxygenase family)